MPSPFETGLFGDFNNWLAREGTIEAVILYGSSARNPRISGVDGWSDFDLHIITYRPDIFDTTNWGELMPAHDFCVQLKRSATGGTSKTTLLFQSGQIDAIVLSRRSMRLAHFAFRAGLHRRIAFVRKALNEMSTSMRTGYRFLKGDKLWRRFYADVVREMPGVRFDDSAVCNLANGFLVTMLLTLKRLQRGECVAAQDMLHRTLGETNFRLMRELRLRRNLPLPSFGLGRRVEQLLSPSELACVAINARLDGDELRRAIWTAFEGLKVLMSEIAPDWRVPPNFYEVVAPYRPGTLGDMD